MFLTTTTGAIDYVRSEVFGLPATVMAGVPSKIAVILRDTFGQAITTGTQTVTMLISGGPTFPCQFNAASGNFTCWYFSNQAGIFSARVQESGNNIQANSFDLTVVSDVIYPPACDAFGPGLLNNTITAGAATFFDVIARDRFGNAVENGSLAFTYGINDGLGTVFNSSTVAMVTSW